MAPPLVYPDQVYDEADETAQHQKLPCRQIRQLLEDELGASAAYAEKELVQA